MTICHIFKMYFTLQNPNTICSTVSLLSAFVIKLLGWYMQEITANFL